MFVYLLILPFVYVYSVGVDSFLYEYLGVPPSTTFLGCTPPSDSIVVDNTEVHTSSSTALDTKFRIKSYYRKRVYIFTGELAIYALIHTCLSFVPGYLVLIALARSVYCFIEILRLIILQGGYGQETSIFLIQHVMRFLRIGNAAIDLLNGVISKYHRIKKSAESLITYSLIPVCLIGISLFYLCKKFFTKKDDKYPQPHTRNTENRNQAMINLGIMLIAFIGWSDFGLWKRFQDWIRMTEYVNKVFGENATDTTCRNFNPNKYDPNCRGTKKGEYLCLTCTATQIPKDPALASRVALDYSIKSIMENPGIYFYPLVNSLVMNYDKNAVSRVPDWYKRLPKFLQEQIFESHYVTVGDMDGFPRKFRLNHEKLMKGDFVIMRNEKIGKWTIVTAETEAALRRLNQGPQRTDCFDNQYIPSDPDSDSEDYKEARKPKTYYENVESKAEKSNGPITNLSPIPHTRNAAQEVALDELEHYYADAFMFDEDEKQDATEAIPLLQQLPKALKTYYRPCLFIAAMCLILYGTFYRFRKYRKQQEMEAKIQEKVSSVVAQNIVDRNVSIPPVLKIDGNLLAPQPESYQENTNKLILDPETYQSRMKDSSRKHARHDPRHNYKHHQREDESQSDFVVQAKQVHQNIKKNKQRSYIVYNLDDLDKLLRDSGIFMIGPDGTGKTVKSREELDLLKNLGYEIDPQDLMKIKKATVDLTNYADDNPIDFSMLRAIVQKKDLTTRQYRVICDMLDDGMNPDFTWKHLFEQYSYDRGQNMYTYISPESKHNEPESKKILQNEIRTKNEVEQQNEELSTPIRPTPEEYEKYKDFLGEYCKMTNNPKLDKKLKAILEQAIVSSPESNLATVKSRDCPYGAACGLKDCIMNHPPIIKPETLCGSVKIDHYPMNMDTQNVFKIYMKDAIGEHHAMCNHTSLGFITNHHTFFYDKKKTRPIDPSLLEVMVEGKRYTISSYTRFPEINGHNGRPIPEPFQDLVYFNIDEDLDLKVDKARPPRDGERVVVVSANQLSADEYSKLPPNRRSSPKTQEAVLHAQPNGLFYFKTNNQGGDSGSAVYSLDQHWAYVGTYFGQAEKDQNTLIPVDHRFLPNINGGVSFKHSKNFKPTA